MTIDEIIFLGRDAMIVTLLVASPMLLSGLVIGLLLGVLGGSRRLCGSI